MAIIDVRVYEIYTSGVADLNNNEWCFESTVDTDLGYRMVGGKNNLGETQKWLAKDQDIKVKAMTSIESSFSSAGYVKNTAAGVLSGGNIISITDIPDRYWNRDTGDGYVYPRNTSDNVALGGNFTPHAREWINITCADWEGMGFTVSDDTYTSATRYSDTTAMMCEVGYNHNEDKYFIYTNSASRFSISYTGDMKLTTGASVNDITTVISEPGDDTTLATEKAIVDYMASISSFWLRNVTDGYLYPKTVTDDIVIGSSSLDPADYYSQLLVYNSTAAGISIVSNTTDGYSDIIFSDTPSAYQGLISYYHGDNTMKFYTAGGVAVTLNSDRNFKLRLGSQYVNKISTETDLNDNGGASNEILCTQLAIKTYVDGVTGFWTRNGGGWIYPTTMSDRVMIGGSVDPDTYGAIAAVYSTSNTNFTLISAIDGWGELRFSDGTGAPYSGYVAYLHDTDYMEIGTNSTPAIDITASQNITFYGDIKCPNVAISSNDIYEHATNSNQSLRLNYYGYDGGISQFRDLYIGDGKSAPIAYFEGSSKQTTVYGTLAVGTSASPASYGTNLLVYESGSPRIAVISSSTGTPGIMFGDGTGSADMGYVKYYNTGNIMRIGANNEDRIIINESGYGSVRVSTDTDGMFFVDDGTTHLIASPVGLAIGPSSPQNPFEIQTFSTDDVKFVNAVYNGSTSTETRRGYIECEVDGNTVHIVFFQPPA